MIFLRNRIHKNQTSFKNKRKLTFPYKMKMTLLLFLPKKKDLPQKNWKMKKRKFLVKNMKVPITPEKNMLIALGKA